RLHQVVGHAFRRDLGVHLGVGGVFLLVDLDAVHLLEAVEHVVGDVGCPHEQVKLGGFDVHLGLRGRAGKAVGGGLAAGLRGEGGGGGGRGRGRGGRGRRGRGGLGGGGAGGGRGRSFRCRGGGGRDGGRCRGRRRRGGQRGRGRGGRRSRGGA